MAIYNSKQAGMVYLSNRIVSFYNQTIQEDAASFSFYENQDDDTPKYQLQLSSFAGKYRCLQYKNFNTYAYQQTVCPYVLYVDSLTGTCNVLFQANFAQPQENNGSVMCTFWSTLSANKNAKLQGELGKSYYEYGKVLSGEKTQYYKYDPALIYRVNTANLDQYEMQETYRNILCAVKIQLQPMYVTGENQEKIQQDVAIIKTLPIVLQQVQGASPAFDFSLNGGGSGGIKQHNHIPHIDGTGFAFAVFHPGTTMPQLAWSSI